MNKQTKKILKKAFQEFWIIKFLKWLFRDRSFCYKCKKNKSNREYNNLCFNCYLKTLKVERGLK